MSFPARLMFPGDGAQNPFTIPGAGRTYLCSANSVLLIGNGEDSRTLQNQGWVSSTGPIGAGSAGPTASRPANPAIGHIYADTTIAATVVYGGKVIGWRNNITGAAA